ncbi:LLM class flavin-dependent oxidoreductase [Trujillonella endophytica]|uniref:Flavin-dependent oxidoreductase, luciferase family (Includes alkanesulfonate monooxygenase SsuD and methylene tetrahydromethanopterin reductase) n=1 Tax=Trujillonella endophytica TaxID=673521 RepID=A0A1H8VYF8_9ACTN|nr:LLM class flavin-dependent oxidoreductase [Trujillella endophytica]SEP19958.1 Flavin-dependent oxidoreductase, luciferase family (includes alkanesulfonate monooxygenase SsuD and methylene tetrahydromethanopterin reductase) [Trujillella endophytica]
MTAPDARAVPAGPRPRIGLVAPGDAALVREAETLGADSLWVGGHLASVNAGVEPLAWLHRLAGQTERVAIGSAVLLLPLYPPALVAKQLADLDRITGGRVVLGIGVGGEYPAEFSAVQVPLAERGRRTDEAIPLMRRLWSGFPVDHAGPAFPMTGVRLQPPPVTPGGPPIVVAGRQAPAMRRAALLGDGWIPYMYSPRRYAESVAAIRRVAEEAGRELTGFRWLAYVPVCVDDDAQRARRDAAAFLGGTYRQDLDPMLDRIAAVGTPAQVAARLREYVAAGADELVLLPCRRDADHLRALLTTVAPAVRSAPGRGTRR